MEKRNSDAVHGWAGRTTRAAKPPLSAKKATPKSSRRFSSPLSARSEASELFSPTVLVNLPSKKLSFGCSDLFPELKIDTELSLPTPIAVQEEPIQVHLRVRPFTANEKSDCKPVITITGEDAVLVEPPEGSRTGERQGTYKFTKVHGPATPQDEFYAAVLKPIVDKSVAHGRNGLLFSYGMTNAGKTFTVLGTEDQPGLLIRAVTDCIDIVKAANSRPRTPAPVLSSSKRHQPSPSIPDLDSAESDITEDMLAAKAAEAEAFSNIPALCEGESLMLSLSCLEIYNEQVFDVLAPPAEVGGARPILKIKDGFNGRVYVNGLKHVDVTTKEDCVAVIQEACRNRKVAETGLNNDSSRSHCVFGVNIWKVVAQALPDPLSLSTTASSFKRSSAVSVSTSSSVQSRSLYSKLSIVDLAGSERQRRTANRGIRLKEAGCINNSLMSLMHCLEAIRWNQKHATVNGGVARLVPFRETKLTRLFQDNLAGAGAGYTVMILNVGPSPSDFDETVHALKYGALAKEIKIAPPKVDSRWAAGTYGADGNKRRRMALIDENAPVDEDGEAAVVAKPADELLAEERAKWELERMELLSQIEDLQSLNATTRSEMRQAEERCAIVEMEVREEVSSQMAALMKEAETRLREVYTKSADERVAKLELMYKMQSKQKRGVTVRRGRSQVVTSRASTSSSEGEGDHSENELALHVAECEDEINRLKTKHAQDRKKWHDEVVGLKAALKAKEDEFDAKVSDLKTAHAQELKLLRESFPKAPQPTVVDSENVAPHDEPIQRRSGKKTSAGGPRKKSGSKKEEVPLSIVELDPADNHSDISENVGVVAQAVAAIESKAPKRQRGVKRRTSDDSVDDDGTVESNPTSPLRPAVAPNDAPKLTFSGSKDKLFQSVLSSAASHITAKKGGGLLSSMLKKAVGIEVEPLAGGNKRTTRNTRRSAEAL